MEEEIRLQKYMAECGIASRRKCEELIMQGKVKVNGQITREVGKKINAEKDKIEYNGQVIKIDNEKIYILLNKPIDYVTTVKDQFGRNRSIRLDKSK